MTVVVERVGLTTVQDAGRRGWAHLGVPRSGAADRSAYLLANRLVGNVPNSAMFETTGGLWLRTLTDTTVVITGAESNSWIDDLPLSHCKATRVPAGKIVRILQLRDGVRCYLAVAGGLRGEPQLGSLSHDTLSNIVPIALQAGVTIAVGPATQPVTNLDTPLTPRHGARLLVQSGPHRSLLTAEQQRTLVAARWTISEHSDRIGIRLKSETSIQFIIPELQSIPLVRGAVQMTPSGELVVMLADHPTTGGYPVIGVVNTSDIDDIAQRPSGATVHLTW